MVIFGWDFMPDKSSDIIEEFFDIFNRILKFLAFFSAPLLVFTGSASAEKGQEGFVSSAVYLPGSHRVDFLSKVNGRLYSISVAIPSSPPPPDGYGVMYVLDGNAYFASAAEAVRANALGVVIVGIGYPDTPEFTKKVLARHDPLPAGLAGLPPFQAAVSIERMFDMTLPATAPQLREQSLPGFMEPRPGDVGGVDDFLRVVEGEVKPRVESLVAVDRSRQALFGHSLGGLAVLRALFTRPDAYQTYIASSPSIWWNDKAVLSEEAAFRASVKSGKVQPRILIAVGGDEEKVPNLPPAMEPYRARVEGMTQKFRMIGNACDLVSRLAKLDGAGRLKVEPCAVFAKQGHGIAAWPALGRGITFAFVDE